MGPVKSGLLIIFMIPLAAIPAFSSGQRESAQEKVVNPAADQDAARGHMGGFRAVEKDNPHVIESVRFLNEELGDRGIRIQNILSSKIQVVSGYKVHIVADYRKNGTIKVLEALIYLPTRGEPQLISVEYAAE